jgi:hypothetical protein
MRTATAIFWNIRVIEVLAFVNNLLESVKGGFIAEKYFQWLIPVCVALENIITVAAGEA